MKKSSKNLESIVPKDIVLGILCLNPYKTFDVDEFVDGLINACSKHKKLLELYENFTFLDKMLEDYTGLFLHYTKDFERLYMDNNGKDYLEKYLKDSYGKKILNDLKPLAKEVWKMCSNED